MFAVLVSVVIGSITFYYKKITPCSNPNYSASTVSGDASCAPQAPIMRPPRASATGEVRCVSCMHLCCPGPLHFSICKVLHQLLCGALLHFCSCLLLPAPLLQSLVPGCLLCHLGRLKQGVHAVNECMQVRCLCGSQFQLFIMVRSSLNSAFRQSVERRCRADLPVCTYVHTCYLQAARWDITVCTSPVAACTPLTCWACCLHASSCCCRSCCRRCSALLCCSHAALPLSSSAAAHFA